MLLAAAGLALLVVVVYFPALSGEFLRLDDYQYIVDNESVRQSSGSSVKRFFSEVARPSTVEGYYQPLTMLSLMLDARLASDAGLDPFVYHLTNVLLHAANCVLVMLLARAVFGGLGVPWLLAALFALHPVQVESVAWISQRKTVLASLFAIAALYLYVLHGFKGGRLHLAASLVLYAVAGLAKPTVMLLPLVLPLLDFWPLRRPVVARLREKAPFLPVLIVMGGIAWVSQASVAGLGRPTVGSATVLVKWLGLLSYNTLQYVGNVVYPIYLSPYRAIPQDMTPANPIIAAALAGMLALLVAWLTAARWSRPLFVGLAGFGIVLLPALGPVRFMGSCVADRFVYLPLLFLVLAFGALVRRFETLFGDRRRWIVWAGAAAICVPLLVLNRVQQGVWQNSKALWTHVGEYAPEVPKAQANLALIALQEEDFETALQHAEHGLKLDPGDAEIMHVLGRTYVRLGRAQEAVAMVRKALETGLGPVEATGQLSLAEAYLAAGDVDAARQACEKAIALGRTPSATYADLGDVAMRFANRQDQAVEYYRLAAQADPKIVLYRWNLGTALHAWGHAAEALEAYEQALQTAAAQGRSVPELEAAVNNLRKELGLTSTSPADK